MKGKISISKFTIIAIGSLLIIANAYELITGHLLPKGDPWSVSELVVLIESYLINIALFPIGLPAILSLFDKGTSIGFVYITVGIWQFAILACGIGLVVFKNFARKSLIVLCITRIILFLISWPITYLLYGSLEDEKLSFSFYDLFTLIIPIIYIIIFTRKPIRLLFVKSNVNIT